MSSPTWTPAALASEAAPWAGECWRVVESQHAASTMKLVDTIDEQALLEDILEDSKPPVPRDCRHLDYLLYTPFRYRNRHGGSRFRPPDEPRGVFYAAAELRTALCEAAFWRLLFFAESPHTPWPDAPLEHTSFGVRIEATRAIDLRQPPFAAHDELWSRPDDYAPCWQLADSARQAGLEAIRYRSVRDPGGGMNIALFSCAAFRDDKPRRRRNWKMFMKSTGVIIMDASGGDEHLALPRQDFAHDPRTAAMNWRRG